jgi:hypothetical protein
VVDLPGQHCHRCDDARRPLLEPVAVLPQERHAVRGVALAPQQRSELPQLGDPEPGRAQTGDEADPAEVVR